MRLSSVGGTDGNAKLSADGRFCYHSPKGAASRLETATGQSRALALPPAAAYGFWNRGSFMLAYGRGVAVFRDNQAEPVRPIEPGELVWCGDGRDGDPVMVLRRQNRLVAVRLSDGSSRTLATDLPPDLERVDVDDKGNPGLARLFGWSLPNGVTRVVTLDGQSADLRPSALDEDGRFSARLSPDGRQVVWCQPAGEAAGTYVRPLGDGEPRRIGPLSECWWSGPETISLVSSDGVYRLGPGDGEPRQVLKADADVPLRVGGTFVSPSGRWALVRREQGRDSVVRVADGRELPLPIGSRAHWQRPLDVLVAEAAEPPVQSRTPETAAPEFALFCPDDPDHVGPSGRAWRAKLSPDGRLLAVLGNRGLEAWAIGGSARSKPVPVQVIGNPYVAGDAIVVREGLRGQLFRAECD